MSGNSQPDTEEYGLRLGPIKILKGVSGINVLTLIGPFILVGIANIVVLVVAIIVLKFDPDPDHV